MLDDRTRPAVLDDRPRPALLADRVGFGEDMRGGPGALVRMG